jgi:HEAT repeat protein
MTDAEQRNAQLDRALKGLVRLFKAIRFYPPAHPALQQALGEAHSAFLPLLQPGPGFTLVVRKEGFLLDEQPVLAGNPLLQKLAHFLFSRRVQRLTLLPDLTPQDLRAFSRSLTLEPGEILRLGGIQEVLRQARVSTIWANEVDLARILALKEEIEEEKALAAAGAEAGEPGGGGEQETAGDLTPEGRDLERVLRELRRAESDQRFRLLLDELLPLVRLNLNDAGRAPVLGALAFLCRTCSSQLQPAQRREVVRQALVQLAGDDVLDFLVATLCRRETPKEAREQAQRILVFLGRRMARRLVDHLAVENDAQARKFLADTLVALGAAATPVLLETLGDERWYVVRNAVAILGEIRAAEATSRFLPLLGHADFRVRRETIRALARIGGSEAVGILLTAVEGNDPELRPQALLSLGAMKDPAAVPTLLRLVEAPDPWVKKSQEKKEAIRALGEIGSATALPVLTRILRQPKLWRRALFAEVRAAAATALGDIGSSEATAALEAATDDRSEVVARAAANALKQLKRGITHESGTP